MQPIEEPQALIEYLCIARSLRWAVVEENDALSQRYGPCGPGDDREILGALTKAAEPHSVEENGNMAAGNHQSRRVVEDFPDLPSVSIESRITLLRQMLFEGSVDGGDARHVLFIEPPQSRDGGLSLDVQKISIALSAQQLPRRLDCEIQAKAIEILHLAQLPLASAVSSKQILLLSEELLASSMESQVHDLAPEMLSHHIHLGFSLLPAGGNRRDLTLKL